MVQLEVIKPIEYSKDFSKLAKMKYLKHSDFLKTKIHEKMIELVKGQFRFLKLVEIVVNDDF
jgi:hypothetical protein